MSERRHCDGVFPSESSCVRCAMMGDRQPLNRTASSLPSVLPTSHVAHPLCDDLGEPLSWSQMLLPVWSLLVAVREDEALATKMTSYVIALSRFLEPHSRCVSVLSGPRYTVA